MLDAIELAQHSIDIHKNYGEARTEQEGVRLDRLVGQVVEAVDYVNKQLKGFSKRRHRWALPPCNVDEDVDLRGGERDLLPELEQIVEDSSLEVERVFIRLRTRMKEKLANYFQKYHL